MQNLLAQTYLASALSSPFTRFCRFL